MFQRATVSVCLLNFGPSLIDVVAMRTMLDPNIGRSSLIVGGPILIGADFGRQIDSVADLDRPQLQFG